MRDRTKGTGRTTGRRPGAARRVLRLLPLLALMAACSHDHSGVRDWSIQAREILLPPLPAEPVAAPPAPGRAAAVQVLREAAGAWLAALAAIADDAAPPDDGTALEARAALVEPFDPVGAAAVVNLSRSIAYASRGHWRAPALAYAIDHGDAAFRAVMESLSREAEALVAGSGQAMPVTGTAIGRIARGHALLAERGAKLGQSETGRLMRTEASDLRRLVASARPRSP